MADPASGANTAQVTTPRSRSTPTAIGSKRIAAPPPFEEERNARQTSQTPVDGRRAEGAGARRHAAPQPEFASPAHRAVASHRADARACLVGAPATGQGLVRLSRPHDRGGMGLYSDRARPRRYRRQRVRGRARRFYGLPDTRYRPSAAQPVRG